MQRLTLDALMITETRTRLSRAADLRKSETAKVDEFVDWFASTVNEACSELDAMRDAPEKEIEPHAQALLQMCMFAKATLPAWLLGRLAEACPPTKKLFVPTRH